MPEEIRKNLFRIPVPLPGPLRELNAYYLRPSDGGRGLLIDTGFLLPQCREALFAGLRELGAPESGVDVALTHFHADHAGLSQEAAGREGFIAISEADSFWLDPEKRAAFRDAEAARQIRDGFPAGAVKNMEKKAAPQEKARRILPLSEGDVLSRAGFQLRAVATPGHTPGHTSFFDERENLLLLGDAVLFDITPNITAERVPDPLGDYLNTLTKLEKYGGCLALPGHRGGGDLKARIAELKAHHAARLDEVCAIVAAEPGLTPYEAASRMRWHIHGANGWEDFPAQQKWFAVGECRAHIDRLALLGRIEKRLEGEVFRCYTVK